MRWTKHPGKPRSCIMLIKRLWLPANTLLASRQAICTQIPRAAILTTCGTANNAALQPTLLKNKTGDHGCISTYPISAKFKPNHFRNYWFEWVHHTPSDVIPPDGAESDALPALPLPSRPRVWNSLPAHLRDEEISYNSFRRELKTYWFRGDRGAMWQIFCLIARYKYPY